MVACRLAAKYSQLNMQWLKSELCEGFFFGKLYFPHLSVFLPYLARGNKIAVY